MCVGQGGIEVCTCVWVRESLRCVHVFGLERSLGVYMSVGQRGLRCVHVCGSGRN